MHSFFDRGAFRVLPLAYFYLPKSARAYLFPNLSKLISFAAAQLAFIPSVRGQGGRGRAAGPRRRAYLHPGVRGGRQAVGARRGSERPAGVVRRRGPRVARGGGHRQGVHR